MANRLSADYPFLKYNKAEGVFRIDCSDLRGAKCDPKPTRDGWEIEMWNPKTNGTAIFKNTKGDCVRDREGEVLYDIFRSKHGLVIHVEND